MTTALIIGYQLLQENLLNVVSFKGLENKGLAPFKNREVAANMHIIGTYVAIQNLM